MPTYTFERTLAQRRKYPDCAEPADHVVDNRDDRRLSWMGWCALDAEQTCDGCADLIESGTILPGALVAMRNDPRMDQARLPFTERFGIEAIALQIARALVGEEYVGILHERIEFRAILLRLIQDRR